MLVICIDADHHLNLLKLNKIYKVKTESNIRYRIILNRLTWFYKRRFKKIKLYPDTKLFKELYPDHIKYQNTIGVISEA